MIRHGESAVLHVAVLLAIGCLIGGFAMPARAAGLRLYVSTNGNDAWSGARDTPFATLERARDAIRALKQAGGLPQGGVTVEIRGGTYELGRPFELTAEDSGSDGAPIVYRARPRERVRLAGGRLVTGFEPVRDPAVLGRLEEAARGHVLQANLRALGITDLGEVASENPLELFFQDKPMTLARWPNESFATILDVVEKDGHQIHGIPGSTVGKFTYEGDRPLRWKGEKDVWLHGYWFWDWSDEYEKVESIDTQERVIALAPPYHAYGYRAGQRFYALNILAELDSPGEWYVDHDTGVLYFWPPGPIEEGRPTISTLPGLISMKNTSHVIFRGLTLEVCRGQAVSIEGGTGNRILDCTIRNTGGGGVGIYGGTLNGVAGCEIYQVGDSGVRLSGGDRQTLTPAGNYAEDNHIHHISRLHRTYRPGVGVDGVGQRVAHNLIHDGPHNAILLGGNDHVIEFNEIHDVCQETGDVGAFYMGRDWTARGTVIRYNYFHDISGPGMYGAMAVYLDDAASGITVFGNVFYKAAAAAFIGGGRDNLVENNVFVDCSPAVHVDARAWVGCATTSKAMGRSRHGCGKCPTRSRRGARGTRNW
jgi:hypothetical protein